MALPTGGTSGYTIFRGHIACDCLAEWLPVYEQMLLKAGIIKRNIDIIQLTGNYILSSGTHAGGGVFDIKQFDERAVSIAREMGAPATWMRVMNFADGSPGNDHTHGVLLGCPHLAAGAAGQLSSQRNGRDGYAKPGVDPHPAPSAYRTWRQGITWAQAELSGKQPRTYKIPKGGTLGAAAIALGTTVGLLAPFNGISDPNVVHPGQVVTAPPPDYKAPAAKPPAKAPAPKPKAPAVKPKPAAQPKPVAKPKPVSNAFRPIANQRGAYLNLLHVGRGNSTSVYRYEQALARYLHAYAGKYGLTGSVASDGYYGTATQAATQAVYRDLAKKCNSCGWTPNATRPGPALLRTLGIPNLGNVR